MKKLFLTLIILFLPLSINAQIYKLEDMNISVDDNWYVFTKDNISNNEQLEMLGIKEEDMNNMFQTTNAYLDALMVEDNDFKELLILVKKIKGLPNTMDLNSKELEELRKAYENQITDAEAEVVETKNNKYIKAMYSDMNLNVLDYYFSYNGIGYTIKFQKEQSFTEGEISVYDEMVKNIELDKKQTPTNQNEEKLEDVSTGMLNGIIKGALIGAMVGVVVYFMKKKK